MAQEPIGGPTWAAAGSIGTAAVVGFWHWLRNRNKLDDATASSMIRKLWKQNEQLNAKVEACEVSHRECEVRAGRLEVEVQGLREDLNDLRGRLDRAGLRE